MIQDLAHMLVRHATHPHVLSSCSRWGIRIHYPRWVQILALPETQGIAFGMSCNATKARFFLFDRHHEPQLQG